MKSDYLQKKILKNDLCKNIRLIKGGSQYDSQYHVWYKYFISKYFRLW